MTKSTAGSVVGDQRPMRADARRNRERLLAAAAEAFMLHGVDASLDDIARRAGVGSGTLYRHFPTREALIEATYRDQVTSLCAGAGRLSDSESPLEALRQWLRYLIRYMATKRGLAGALMEHYGKDNEVFTACHMEMRAAAKALQLRAERSGDIRPDVSVPDLMKLMHGIAVATEHAPDGDEIVDRLLTVVIDGLRPRTPSPEQPQADA